MLGEVRLFVFKDVIRVGFGLICVRGVVLCKLGGCSHELGESLEEQSLVRVWWEGSSGDLLSWGGCWFEEWVSLRRNLSSSVSIQSSR